jgi:hypothetical protein
VSIKCHCAVSSDPQWKVLHSRQNKEITQMRSPILHSRSSWHSFSHDERIQMHHHSTRCWNSCNNSSHCPPLPLCQSEEVWDAWLDFWLGFHEAFPLCQKEFVVVIAIWIVEMFVFAIFDFMTAEWVKLRGERDWLAKTWWLKSAEWHNIDAKVILS